MSELLAGLESMLFLSERGETVSSFLHDAERWLSSGEVAEIFGVDPKTVGRWEAAGKLHARRTLGGHRRFSESEVYRLLWGGDEGAILGEGGLTVSDESG